MSTIRTDLPNLSPQPVPAAARTAQAAFFRAALAGTEAASRPVIPPASSPATASAQTQEPRPTRPGSLLDIRV